MKLLTQIVTVLLASAVCLVAACNKTTTTPPTTTPTATACNGKLLCYKLDGTTASHDSVVWRKIAASGSNPERYRIYWEAAGGASNIEIDVYATTTGTYNIKNGSAYAVNDASFQYYFQSGAKIMEGVSGTVEITSIDNTKNTITGKFTVTAQDTKNGNSTHQFTEGNFVNVPFK